MNSFIYQRWWKAAAVIFLLYAIIVGFSLPLSPAINSIDPQSATIDNPQGSSFQINVKGYNTHFDNSSNLKAWIICNDEKDTFILCGSNINVKSSTEATITYHLPAHLPFNHDTVLANFVMNDTKDGSFGLDNSFFIYGNKKFSTGILDLSCKAESESNKTSYISFPFREVLHETIRNLFFHVPMWFGMMLLLGISLFYSIKYLRNMREDDDLVAVEFVNAGLLMGICGIITGMVWAQYTWGKWWVKDDPKLNGAAVVLLEYFAYIILRGSINDERQKARVSAVYNIFAAASVIPLLFILPKMNDSLHPGNGGNPGFKAYDLDKTMRLVFYPAVIGWALLGFWLASLRIRIKRVEHKLYENE